MKYFIDCGFYQGKALEYYAPFIDDSWTVIVFEPNTNLEVEKTLKNFPFKIEWIKKAVWTTDGMVDFRIAGRNDASHIDSIRTSTDEKISVPSIDFSKFIKDLPEPATIVCSFDIEGAEFPVLRKMIADGTVQRISLIDIEFHSRLLENEDGGTASSLRMELESLGVLVKLKLEI